MHFYSIQAKVTLKIEANCYGTAVLRWKDEKERNLRNAIISFG